MHAVFDRSIGIAIGLKISNEFLSGLFIVRLQESDRIIDLLCDRVRLFCGKITRTAFAAKMQPLVSSVPSRFGQVIPASKASLYIFCPKVSFK